MITKTESVGKIEILADRTLQIRTDTIIAENGIELTRVYRYHLLASGDNLSNEDPHVRAHAAVAWGALATK